MLHGRRQLVLLRCMVNSENERNPLIYLLLFFLLNLLALYLYCPLKGEEGGDHARSSWLLWNGLHMCCNGHYNALLLGNWLLIVKFGLSSDCGVQIPTLSWIW